MKTVSPGPESVATYDPWHTHAVCIQRVLSEGPDVWTYDVKFKDSAIADAYRFLPGQFNMLYVPGAGEAAISIAGYSSDRRSIRHTIRSVGAVTRAIEAGGVGMTLGLRGPFGTSWPADQLCQPSPKKDVIVVAGGIGLAPLRSLVMHIIANRHVVDNVHLLLGARSPEDLLYQHELSEWKSHDISVETTVDRPAVKWKGHVGVVTLLLERLRIPKPESTFVMTCGPEVMMRYVAKSAIERGIPEAHLWVTLERNMNCAIGLCGHCQLGPQFLCKDGPVFQYDHVRDWLRVQDL